MSKWSLFLGMVVTAFVLFGMMSGGDFLHVQEFENEFLPGQKIEEQNGLFEPKNEAESVHVNTLNEQEDDDWFGLPGDDTLDILAFGDMMLGRYVRTLMDKNGKAYIFEKLGKPGELMGEENVDVVFANLEGPIKGEGYHAQEGMVFGFNEDTAPYLKENGINLVSIANNHSNDQRWEGRATTMSALKDAGVGFCGHPSEADPESVYYGDEEGISFAFVCFNSVNFPLDMEKAVELIGSVNKEVEHVIVSIHWGVEYSHTPNLKLQVEPAHAFVDAGADIVIGHHPHVIQSFEIYNKVPIFYSLGNFVFDQYFSRDVQEELGIFVSIGDDDLRVKLIPMKSEKSQVRLMTEEEKKEWVERFIKYGTYDEGMQDRIRDLEFVMEK